MKTKLFVPAVLAAAIGFASLSSATAASYSESADTVKNVTAATSAPEKSASKATDLHAQMKTDVRPSGPTRGANPDSDAKGRPGPAMMFQLRDAAGG